MDEAVALLLAEQADQIARLRDERDNLAARIELATKGETPEPDPYWSGVYDNIRAAWDKWALAELGTSSPSPMDLTGRPELAELWDAVR